MNKNMKAFVSCAGIIVALICAGPAFAEDKAIDQLQGMTNTGITFDGSDGQRFGMDINVSPSAGDVPVPTPSPASNYDVGTSSGTQSSNFSVNSSTPAAVSQSSGTAQGASQNFSSGTPRTDAGSGTKKRATKKGTEYAE